LRTFAPTCGIGDRFGFIVSLASVLAIWVPHHHTSSIAEDSPVHAADAYQRPRVGRACVEGEVLGSVDESKLALLREQRWRSAAATWC